MTATKRRYSLKDAEMIAADNPRTFDRLSAEELDEVLPGWFVKLCFTCDCYDAPPERMWVEVNLRYKDEFVGQLRNKPLHDCFGKFHDVVQFEMKHIYSVMAPERVRFYEASPPPPRYPRSVEP